MILLRVHFGENVALRRRYSKELGTSQVVEYVSVQLGGKEQMYIHAISRSGFVSGGRTCDWGLLKQRFLLLPWPLGHPRGSFTLVERTAQKQPPCARQVNASSSEFNLIDDIVFSCPTLSAGMPLRSYSYCIK